MNTQPVPFVDLAAQMAEIADEIRPEIDRVLSTAAFIGGDVVTRFEREFAAYVDVEHCVGVGNGTDALELALRGLEVGPGDEVILPTGTFIATAEAVSRIGAVPVLVDVDPVHLLIDPDAVAAAITPRTRAVIAVHLFGQTAPMERLAEVVAGSGIALVEDAAQSQGARRHGRPAGSLSDVAATSFYPGKNLGAAGDAGAVMTSNAAVAERVRILAAHGSPRKYVHDLIGMNSRLDAIQAVVLQAKLGRLDKWNALRNDAADRYAELLADVPGLQLPARAPGNEDVWHLYVVRLDDRDRVLAELGEAGIGAGIHYPTPVHLTAAYAHLGHPTGTFPVAEEAAGRILSLPMFPHLAEEQQVQVARALTHALR